MADSLARIEGTSVDDLVQIAESIQELIRKEDSETRETAIDRLSRRPGVIKRLFPTAYEKETQRIDISRLRALATSREKVFYVYTEVQLEIARKQGDALIASIGMHLQAKLTAFALEKIDEIGATISDSRSKFLRTFAPLLEEAEQVRAYPDLHKAAKESLAQQQQVYFDTLKKLLEGFVESLETRVGRS